MTTFPLTVMINGQAMSLALAKVNPLYRAVIISLFTWRRARPDDELPADERMGWWGDTFPKVQHDRIGSRLWLLTREKITSATPLKAKEYIEEALTWLLEDGIASRIDVTAERQGLSMLVATCQIYKPDGSMEDIRFANIWDFLR